MKWLETLVGEAQSQVSEREREVLWSRGATDEQIAAYRIGYLDQYLPVASYPKAFVEWWEDQPRDDVFVFPLTNTLGHLRGIQLRHVDEDRKGYTDFILDNEEPVIFGLAQAMPFVWKKGSICIVEGVFDLFPVQRHMPYVVATLHAGISKPLWRIIQRLVSGFDQHPQVYVAYDNDPTGRKVSYQVVKDYRDHFNIQILKYLQRIQYRGRDAKDPGEVWQALGDELFGVLLRKEFDLIHYRET